VIAQPLVLAFDTSHRKGGVAVARGTELVCEVLFDAADTHSATLMPSIDVAMRTASTKIEEIDLFAVTIGPGSFTGLRIGLATAKAFAAIRRRPLVPVTSLEVLASAFPFAVENVLPLIDAHRGEVYGALYSTKAGSPEELVAPFSSGPDGIGEKVAGRGPLIVCGTGFERYRDVLSKLAADGGRAAGKDRSIPAASLLARIALDREPVPYESLPFVEPLYIRPPDAKLPASTRLREGGGG
jgi:tRNA threonylcarbamoyladenosine biosynthesis protein TsaB